jgi:hypothetical protein
MMDLYYEVIKLDKRKGCRFKFTSVKSKEVIIQGTVDVDFGKKENFICFDPQSDVRLSREEKEYIVTYVLKYIERGKK